MKSKRSSPPRRAECASSAASPVGLINPLVVDDDSLQPGLFSGQPALKRGLSQYGNSNPSEMIAEGFAEWELSSHPRPIAAAIGNLIEKNFKGR
jgi:hypothetical protein